MSNPYTILGIPQNYKNQSIKHLFSTLKAHWEAVDEIYSKEEYDEFIQRLESEPDENKKKELLCDKLVEVKYYFFKANVEKNLKKYQASLEKATIRKDDEEVARLQEKLEINRRKLQNLPKCYEMLNTEEKRRCYYERAIQPKTISHEESQRGGKNYEDSLKRHEEILERLKKSVEELRIKQEVEKEEKEGIEEIEEEEILFTQGKSTIEMLEQSRQRNKKKIDPDNNFKQYTGYSYRWSFQDTREGDACVTNGKNEKNEQVIAIKLGEFNYQTLIHPPTEEHPEGEPAYQERVDIVGVSKLDSKGTLLRNEVILMRINKEDIMQNRYFVREVLFSDENIDRAILNNNGFIGSVSHKEDGSCYIEYNSAGDVELVTALELANYVGGVKNNRWYDKKVGTFDKVKEDFKKMQTCYVKCIMKHKEGKSKLKGDVVWEK